MRWNEIIVEELGVVQMAKSHIMDIIAPLKAQGVESITVQQIIDQISKSPDFEGMAIESDLINQALKNIKNLNIEPDPTTGQMSVMWNIPTAGRQVGKEKSEREDKAVRAAALRSVERKTK